MMTAGRTIDDLHVGETAELTRAVTAEEIAAFLALTGDTNAVHSDPAMMAQTRFHEPIVPGMWTASLLSVAIGTRLPGPGCIYVSQDLRFLRPVKVGDAVTARVEVVEIVRERNRVRLKTACTNQRGEVVLAGEAWVLPRKPAAVVEDGSAIAASL